MADLDNFFAKKDRKKSKSKKLGFSTEEIARKMEETGRKVEKPKKEKISMMSANFGTVGEVDDITGNNEEDEEWKEFKEEKKDYTGLKIQNLSLQDYDDSDDGDGDYDGDSDENDSQDANSKKKGPWKVVENVVNTTAAPEKKAEAPSSPANVSKYYLPPTLRNKQLHRDGTSRSGPVGKPEAPDINNQQYFPSLSAANSEPSASWKRKQDAGFEEVRNSRSHSSRNDVSRTPQTVRIGNKFGALETENS